MLGPAFKYMTAVNIDPNSQWLLSGQTNAFTRPVIDGFAAGDTIDLIGVNDTIGSFGSGVLTLTGSVPLDIKLSGNFTTGQFRAAPSKRWHRHHHRPAYLYMERRQRRQLERCRRLVPTGGPPGSLDVAVIPSGKSVTVSNAQAVATLDIAGGAVEVGGGGTLSNDGAIFGFGTLGIAGALDNSGGSIEANGGLLDIAGAINGGSLVVDAGATLELGDAASGAVPVSFSADSGLLRIDVTDTAGTFSQVGSLAVSNFFADDTIEIAGTVTGGGSFPGVTVDANGNTLEIFGGGKTIGVLSFTNSSSTLLSQDANHDEIITGASHNPTFIWVGLNGADWSVAGDWSPVGPPGAANIAIVESGASVSIGSTASAAVLDLADGATLKVAAGATFASGGVIDNDGIFQDAGTLVIAGALVTLDGGGTLTLDGTNESSAVLALATGHTLVNVNDSITGVGDIGGGTLGLTNEAGGVIYVDKDASAGTTLTLDPAGTLVNAGLIHADTGNIVITAPVNNSGELLSSFALLTLKAGGSSSGRIEAVNNVEVDGSLANTGTIENAFGPLDIVGTLNNSGMFLVDFNGRPDVQGMLGNTGTVSITANDLGWAGSIDNIAGEIDVTGSSLELSGTIANAAMIVAGNLGTVDLEGNTDNAGTIEATGGTVIIGGEISGGRLIEAAGGDIVATGGTLDGSGSAIVGNAATTINVVGRLALLGTFDTIDFAVAAGATIMLGGGSVAIDDGATTLVNAGDILGHGSLSVSGAVVNNAGGTIEASSGSLIFAGVLSGGSLAVDANATLDLASGWYGGGGALPTKVGGDGLLKIHVTDTAGSFSQVGSLAVSSFAVGATIEIAGTVAGGGSFPGVTVNKNGNTLDVVAGGQTIGVLAFAGGTSQIALSQDANKDEFITSLGSTYTWAGPGGADWGVASDWSPVSGPPGVADDAVIPAGGTVAVGEAQSIDMISLAIGAEVRIANNVAFVMAGATDSGGTIAASNGATVSNTGTVVGFGALSMAGGTLDNTGGVMEASGGLLDFTGALTGGSLAVDAGATLELGSGWDQASGPVPVSFSGTTGLLRFDWISSSVGNNGWNTPLVVSGFNANDTIEIAATQLASGTVQVFGGNYEPNSTVSVYNNAGSIGTLQFVGGSASLDIINDQNGDVFITEADAVVPAFTWTGGASGADWSVAADWSPAGGPPRQTDTAVIPSGGTVTVGGNFEEITTMSLAAGAAMRIAAGAGFYVYGSIDNAGTVDDAGGRFQIDGGVSVSNRGAIVGFGTIIDAGSLNNTGGTIGASGGLLDFVGALDAGSLAVDAGATLELGSGWYGGGGSLPVAFNAASGRLQVDVTDTGGLFSQVGSLTISNFVAGDTIEIAGAPGVSVNQDGNTLDIVGGGQTIGVLAFTGSPTIMFGQDVSNDEIITNPGPTHGPDFVVTNATAGDTTDLNQVLRLISIGGVDSDANTSYTITLGADITVTADLTAIDLASGDSLTIEAGAGSTLDGAGQYRGLFVQQGNVTIENLAIQNAYAVGGGAGGAGFGGGLFVAAGGTASLIGTNFANDGAVGETGGEAAGGDVYIQQGAVLQVQSGTLGAGTSNPATGQLHRRWQRNFHGVRRRPDYAGSATRADRRHCRRHCNVWRELRGGGRSRRRAAILEADNCTRRMSPLAVAARSCSACPAPRARAKSCSLGMATARCGSRQACISMSSTRSRGSWMAVRSPTTKPATRSICRGCRLSAARPPS